MRIAVTGSIALDYLMTFPGRFTDSLIRDRLDHVSLSFLTDRLTIRYGGVAANIAIGMARLGLPPVLAAAAGSDFGEYGSRLTANGVDTQHVRISEDQLTARFVCTTDADQNQIASFYAGAMSEASEIKLGFMGPFDLVLIGANDPAAMLSHTAECQASGYRFAADLSQQLSLMDGDDVRYLVAGAAYLFTNEYEHALLLRKTGWSEEEALASVSCWITTMGSSGVRIERAHRPPILIPAVPARLEQDPTGVGDGFRAGFLAGTANGLSTADSARLGCAVATLVLGSNGPQEYEVVPHMLAVDLTAAYGERAVERIATRWPVLTTPTR